MCFQKNKKASEINEVCQFLISLGKQNRQTLKLIEDKKLEIQDKKEKISVIKSKVIYIFKNQNIHFICDYKILSYKLKCQMLINIF